MDRAATLRIQNEIVETLAKRDIDQFEKILQANPEWPTAQSWLGKPHDRAIESFETFKAFVEAFPQTKDWDCGHTGNPVGIAAVRGDVPLLKYLLEDLGHCANAGCFCYSPALYCVADKNDRLEVQDLLKKHGATMEGEGVCYQQSHRLPTGKLCWHKGGKPNLPKCGWSAAEAVPTESPEEMIERTKKLFG
ncbi:hypothetical protein T440DRAFT_468568 [Plenodomus tracheiphilus IPT5]|uniref:Ankyrin n=1 Tax=Plenodomus tracheiphilus IPT5 TaxID=1408161 RepID=A0A6A7B5B5_9PLEO|nr:hypothetical protein T440DRAFT_468568 [Plenodomus tracheiphilus IPT5]